MPSVIAPFRRFGQWKTVEGFVTNLRNQCNGNKWPIWPMDGGYIITVAFNVSMKYPSVHPQVCGHCTGSSNTCCIYRKLLCFCYNLAIKEAA